MTKRKLKDSTHEASLLAAIVESSDDAIVSKDLRGIVTSWNKSAERIFGYTADEMIGQSITKIIPEERLNEEKEILRRTRRGESVDHFETVRVTKTGQRVYVSLTISPIRDATGKVVGASKILRDITKLKEAQEAMRESEVRKGAILDSALDCIITIDHESKIIEVNAAVEKVFGYQREEMLGKNMAELIIPARYREAHYRGLAHYLRTGQGPVLGRRVELSALRRDGTEFPVELGIVPIERGGTPLFTGTLRDITERKQAEAEIQQLNRNLELKVEERTARLREMVAELESYSYSISHDMRAPLRAMQAYAQVLLSEYHDRLDEAGRRYLDRIISSSNRLDKLIQDVLSYSRISRADVQLEAINLDRLVPDIVHEYPTVQAAQVQIRSPLGSVVAAEALLTQAIANLLTNAAKFVAPGKTPCIQIWSEMVTGDSRPALRLYIQDNGIGIAPEHQQRIFGIFARIHSEKEYEGTGIGLSIVKKAVERMGGQLGLQSEAGKGSTFWLQLPTA